MQRWNCVDVEKLDEETGCEKMIDRNCLLPQGTGTKDIVMMPEVAGLSFVINTRPIDGKSVMLHFSSAFSSPQFTNTSGLDLGSFASYEFSHPAANDRDENAHFYLESHHLHQRR